MDDKNSKAAGVKDLKGARSERKSEASTRVAMVCT